MSNLTGLAGGKEMSETVIINVKGVRKNSWNAATQAASLRKEQYGPYLSEALDLRLRFDSGEVQLPGKDGNQRANTPLTEDQRTARIVALAELAKGIAAVKQHTGKATGITMLSAELSSLATKPEAKLRIIGGKESRGFGQSGRIMRDSLLPDSTNHEQHDVSAMVQARSESP
jgi:hypothetical protein